MMNMIRFAGGILLLGLVSGCGGREAGTTAHHDAAAGSAADQTTHRAEPTPPLGPTENTNSTPTPEPPRAVRTVEPAAAGAGDATEQVRKNLGNLMVIDLQGQWTVDEASAIYLESLGHQGTAQVLPRLSDSSPAVRRGAAFYLLEKFDARDPPMLAAFHAALEDEDAMVRNIALQAIQSLPKPDLVDALPRLTAMLDPNREKPTHRAAVARLIGSLESAAHDVLPALQHAARNDPDVAVRKASLFAAVRIGDEAWSATFLQEALQDPDLGVRRLAAVRLSRLGPSAEPATETLCQLLEDDDKQLRDSAVTALLQIGPPAVKPLLQKLESSNSRTRQLAEALLRRIQRPSL